MDGRTPHRRAHAPAVQALITTHSASPTHLPLSPPHPQEDERLTALVRRLGTKHWTAVAAAMRTRSGKSCRLR